MRRNWIAIRTHLTGGSPRCKPSAHGGDGPAARGATAQQGFRPGSESAQQLLQALQLR
jgi:hypothetical protein